MTTKLDAIRQREQAATPGPWEAGTKVEGLYGLNGTIISQSETGGYVAADIAFGGENAAFIAASRTDVPLLLEAVSCLQAIAEFPTPTEVIYDEFAYERMVESFRDAARAALAPLLEPEG